MDTLIAFIVAAALTLFFLRNYFKGIKERDAKARAAAEKGKLFSEGPKAQHPHIDNTYCIGCATCTLPGSGRDGRWAGSEKTECGLHEAPVGG